MGNYFLFKSSFFFNSNSSGVIIPSSNKVLYSLNNDGISLNKIKVIIPI